MARTTLDNQLQDIKAKIVCLGKYAQTALEESLHALEIDDQELCNRIIASDRRIDDLRSEVERQAFRALILQQPLAGYDLRFLSSVPAIASGLERIGDNAVGIAKLLVRMAPLRVGGISQFQVNSEKQDGEKQVAIPNHVVNEKTIITGLLQLGQEGCRVLEETMQVFTHESAAEARALWQEDDVVDVRYHMVQNDLMTMLNAMHAIPALQHDNLIMQRMTYWLWIAHNIERIGDHCTNICERVVFALDGDSTIIQQQED
jgi:phosphate transport system protein